MCWVYFQRRLLQIYCIWERVKKNIMGERDGIHYLHNEPFHLCPQYFLTVTHLPKKGENWSIQDAISLINPTLNMVVMAALLVAQGLRG